MLRILTTLYNAIDYLPKCIESIQKQSVRDWRCYVTDDISTDGSLALARKLTENDDRFEIVANERKQFQPGNYHQIISRPEVDDNDIIITVDGDDWLPDNRVFERVVSTYIDDSVWITYGSFVIARQGGYFEQGFSKPTDLTRLRDSEWGTSHLRTWKAFLWRHLREEDLRAPSGDFWEVAGDVAFMFPMLEMAGKLHTRYISQINYIYNGYNPISDYVVHAQKSQRYAEMIRKMEPYAPLLR